MATLLPEGKQSFENSAGAPLVGGKVYTYDAGTNTPRPTYQDAAGTIPNTNPIILDARGEATIFWSGAYKVVLKDASDVTLWTVDNVTDVAGVLQANLAAATGGGLVGFSHATTYGQGTVGLALQGEINVKNAPYNAKIDGVTDDTAAINAAIATGRPVYIPDGTCLANIVVTTSTFDIRGAGMNRTIIKPFNNALPAFKNMSDPGDANFWMRSRLCALSLQGTGFVGNGFTFGDPAAFAVGNQRIGRVDMYEVGITGFNKGVFKVCGNIGNNYFGCRVQNNNYNYYAQSDDYASGGSPSMHTGYDTWHGGAWGYAGLANIFIKDRMVGKGGWVFNCVDLEGSTGYCVAAFADSTFDYVPGLVFNNSWFEANATGGSITIDGLTGTITGVPRDIYLSGIKSAVLRGAYVGKITLLSGTNLVFDQCGTDTLTAGIFDMVTDANSTYVFQGWQYTTGMKKGLVLPPFAATTDNASVNYTGVQNTVPSDVSAPVRDYTVAAGYSCTAPIIGGGYNGTVVADGMTFKSCLEYVVTGATNGVIPNATTVVGKYYAVTFQARLVTGSNANLTVNNMTPAILVDHANWKQYSFVKKATAATASLSAASTGASSTIRIGGVQFVQFDTAQEAYEYLYRNRFATNSDARSADYPLAAFTDVGGGGASFNSMNVAVTLTTSGYSKIGEASFRGDLTKIKVDFLVAFNDLSTGAALDQLSGFTTVSFASTAATPTQVFGASTVTFRWVQQGTTSVWDLQGQAAGTPCVLAGLAFVKGK